MKKENQRKEAGYEHYTHWIPSSCSKIAKKKKKLSRFLPGHWILRLRGKYAPPIYIFMTLRKSVTKLHEEKLIKIQSWYVWWFTQRIEIKRYEAFYMVPPIHINE